MLLAYHKFEGETSEVIFCVYIFVHKVFWELNFTAAFDNVEFNITSFGEKK